MRRTFDLDVLACPCGERLRFLALVTEREAISNVASGFARRRAEVRALRGEKRRSCRTELRLPPLLPAPVRGWTGVEAVRLSTSCPHPLDGIEPSGPRQDGSAHGHVARRGRHLERLGLDRARITELDWWEEVTLPGGPGATSTSAPKRLARLRDARERHAPARALGTFDLGLHAWDEPADTLLSLAEAADARVLTPQLGRPFLPERGAGVGAALLDEGLALAAARRGWLAVELEIERGHERAANLYERAGFRPLTRTRWSRRVVAFAMPPQPV